MSMIQELEDLRARVENLQAQESPNVTGFTNYAATSTIVGWSAFTIKEIYYSRIGRLVYVQFFIDGTSNSVNTSFTLPYTAAPDISVIELYQARDNSGTPVAGVLQVLGSSSTVTFYATAAAGAWTAAGTKQVRGQFFYMAAV